MQHRSPLSRSIFRQCALAGLLLLSTLRIEAQQIFNPRELHTIQVFCAEANWFDSLQVYYDAAQNGAANRFVKVQTVIDNDTVPNVGLRFKGKYSNYGFPGPKKPFRLDFNEYDSDQKYEGLTKLNLHNCAGDPSFLREYMAYDLLRYVDVPAPHASFCKLYINGAYWGCYEIAEEPDKVFLKKNFGNKNGNLFECTGGTRLDWKGPDPGAYPELELKTDSTAASWEKLIHWLDLMNNDHSYDFSQQLSEAFATDDYFKALAIDVLVNNIDAYSSNGRNFFLYDDPQSGRIHWIPWDYNLSFWKDGPGPIPQIHNSGYYQPLVYRIKENDYLRMAYLKAFCYLLDRQLSSYPFGEKSKQAYELIRSAVEDDPNKFYTNADFYANRTDGVTVNMLRNNQPTDVYLPGLTTFYENQKARLRRLLFAEGCDCGDIDANSTALSGVIFPNPASADITIYINDNIDGEKAEVLIYDLRGKLLLSELVTAGAGSIHCTTSALTAGVYIVKVNAIHKSLYTKLIKN